MMRMPAVGSWIPDELPRVRGIGWWLFLPIWLTVLAFAGVGTTATLADAWALRGTVSSAGAVGIGLEGDDQGRPVIAYPQTVEATRAGIVSGLRVVAVDGHPVTGELEARERLAGETGTIAHLETVSPDGRRALHRLTRDPAHLHEAYRKAYLHRSVLFAAQVLGYYVGAGFLPLLCGALLLARRPGDRLAPWASLALLLCGLSFGPAEATYANSDQTSSVYDIIEVVATALLLLILLLFPDGRFTSGRTKIMGLVTVAAASLVQMMTGFVGGNLVLTASLAFTVLVITRRMRRHADIEQIQQIRWVLAGFAGAALALALYTAAVTLRNNAGSIEAWIWSDLIGWLLVFSFLALLFGGITIGLLRYRLYDAEATISRSVAYGAITLLLLAIFTGSGKVIELLGEEYFGQSLGRLAGVLGAAMAAVCIGPIHSRVTHWAEKRFRSGLVHLRQGLPVLVGDMRETASPAVLADAMLVRVERGVRAAHGAVVVGDAAIAVRDMSGDAVDAWLASHRSTLVSADRLQTDRTDAVFPFRVPLRVEDVGDAGWLLLGPRPDGSLYGKDERETLAAIADPVARALLIAMERERRFVERQEREALTQLRIDSLYRFIYGKYGVERLSSTISSSSLEHRDSHQTAFRQSRCASVRAL